MKRRYYKNPGRKKIQMEAMLNMKKARREIDPALLEQAQQAIADAWFARHESTGVNEDAQQADEGLVPVDLRQNLSVIQKFIEMNPDNLPLQKQIKSMISENLQ
jgi:hypothetical protein